MPTPEQVTEIRGRTAQLWLATQAHASAHEPCGWSVGEGVLSRETDTINGTDGGQADRSQH